MARHGGAHLVPATQETAARVQGQPGQHSESLSLWERTETKQQGPEFVPQCNE
jgi:hypothetical protein